MGNYYMTIKMMSESSIWEKCKSQSLVAAKKEATRKYLDGYIDAEIVIAQGDNVKTQRYEVARKENTIGGKWSQPV